MQWVASRSLGESGSEVDDVQVKFDDSGSDRGGGRPDQGEIDTSEESSIERGESFEVAALTDEMSRRAALRLRQRRLTYNPLHAYGQMIRCSEDEDSPHNGKRGVRDNGGALRALKQRLTIVKWLPRLDHSTVRADIVAGFTVGVMVIPQSMSYASIAGLPYATGMYSACVPTLVYSIFGQSRQLAVGPVAIMSLLMEAGLRGALDESHCPGWVRRGSLQQYEVCPEEYASLAMLTAAVAGVTQIIASVLKLGFVVSFVGHPVTSGFTSGAAIIIGLSQLEYLLGLNVAKSHFVHTTIANIFSKLPDTNGYTALLGIACVGFLFCSKKLAQKYRRLAMLCPLGPFVCCIFTTLLMMLCEPLREDLHVEVVGDVRSGLMPVSISNWDLTLLPAVMSTALAACIIGYMESLAIGKNLAAKHGYDIEAGQELFSLGMANLVGAAFSCYPVAGSVSRSAVSNSMGARSQLSGIVTGVTVLSTLLLLTPLIYFLPKFMLAAIVINSVLPLVAYTEPAKLWRVKRNDFVLWVVAFGGTLFLGVLMGICVAIAFSLAIVILESVRPQISILWRIPGTTIYRSMKQESSGVFVPNVFICRLGSSMYFANVSFIQETLLGYVVDLDDVNPTEYIVLEMTPVVNIDSTAVRLIHDLVSDFRRRGIQVAFVMVGNRVEKTMRKALLREFIGEHWFFPTVNEAVQYCLRHQQAKRRARRPAGKESQGPAKATNVVPTVSEEEVAAVAVSARPGNEVGFSNGLHHAWTVVFVSLVRSPPFLVDEIAAIFKQSHIAVVNSTVERLEKGGARFTYFVHSVKHAAKLKEALDAERKVNERVRAELDLQSRRLDALLGKQSQDTSGSSQSSSTASSTPSQLRAI